MAQGVLIAPEQGAAGVAVDRVDREGRGVAGRVDVGRAYVEEGARRDGGPGAMRMMVPGKSRIRVQGAEHEGQCGGDQGRAAKEATRRRLQLDHSDPRLKIRVTKAQTRASPRGYAVAVTPGLSRRPAGARRQTGWVNLRRKTYAAVHNAA